MTVTLHKGDLPAGLDFGSAVAVDTETQGLSLVRDKLCLARFDVAILARDLGVDLNPIFCTKIASGLVRTYTDRHGLKDLTRELLNVDLSKLQQSSDWAADELTKAQLDYAASDVLYLHQLRNILMARLLRENRLDMARNCFDFIPTRCELDLNGWDGVDIFSHKMRRGD
jgi:ribonuclease D